MDNVKKHFEDEAHEFDQIIRQLTPYYDEMLDALLLALSSSVSGPTKVIDLGCGTGTVARRIKDTFPDANITCVDIAENMLKMAKKKLGNNARYQLADFRSYEFDGTYDVVVSSLALHHLETDDDKKRFFRKIFNGLVPGGAFYNADVILASGSRVQEGYIKKWKDFMRKQVSDDEIESKWIPMHHEEDRPARLTAQMAWLDDIGFSEIDVVWKYYNFAVYGGIKSL